MDCLAPSGASREANSSGVVGAIGAISPNSGSCLCDVPEQWHGAEEPECEPCGRQHIMGHVVDSQAIARASSASGVASSASITTAI